MNARTALEIALDLDAASCSSFVKLESAEALRKQHAELGRLAMKNAAYASLTKAQDAELSLHRDRAAAYRVAVKNIDSEREVNAILTAERDAAISEAVAAEREAHAAEIDRLKRERHHIYDLLARIHRDGGQYTAENGVEKSCDDAEAQVVAWLDTISGIDSLIEQAGIAEREACISAAESVRGPGRYAAHDYSCNLAIGYAVSAIRARSST